MVLNSSCTNYSLRAITISTDFQAAQLPAFQTMKRTTSVCRSFHRRFHTVESYVKELGGSQRKVIEKVLIANNGVAAVKAIRSIRKWAYEVFGDERAIQFVVMATPEDLRANAEYIRMADTIVDVPGSSNNHNYANVTLIVELARLHGVQAVWAGWGHASENPLLPDTLAQSNPPIKFIGPSGPPMRALGDKIGSTIIAQTAGVPCIAWNGQNVKANYDKHSGQLPEEAYQRATVKSVAEATKAAAQVGFPIMIKASEGGGGKGIRMVAHAEGVPDAYRQVCGEVPGSPIFIMKLSSNSRHLEVQLLADEYGDAIALNGRDCSVQRRHQKIIEEGPPIAAKPEIWEEMERAAISLAKAVGYANAGTVEYLYSESTEKFYFLELNPRLQVEHPVTEMITGVNLPAAQLQVAMGIPLRHIPEIRELYGRSRFEEEGVPTAIDFENEKRVEPRGHCIAVRITAENAEAGFKPTSGGIQELNFRSTPNVWGYFSMDSSGSIHEFADSQFGHLFANGPDREQARRNMALALKELSIRGDISTTVDYISKLMELDEYVDNEIHTGWLDGLIKSGSVQMGAKSNKKNNSNDATSRSNDSRASPHAAVVIGTTVKAYEKSLSGERQFVDALKKGQLPATGLLSMSQKVELILDNVKYRLQCDRIGPNTFSIKVLNEEGLQGPPGHVVTHVRVLSDGGYLIAKGEKSHVAYLISKGDAASGMRLSLNGATVNFSPDYDPSSLRTDVAGKLVKKLVCDGTHLNKGQAYGEIEVMKMFMPLRVEESGTITWNVNEGASLAAGDLLAKLELDNPDNVATPIVFCDALLVNGWVTKGDNTDMKSRPNLLLRKALEKLRVGVSGFLLDEVGLESALCEFEDAIKNPLLPVLEVEEKLSVLRGRIDGELFSQLGNIISVFKVQYEKSRDTISRFYAEAIEQKIMEHAAMLPDASEHSSFVALTGPLRETLSPYLRERVPGVQGSERALLCLLDLLRLWTFAERWFSEGTSYADSVDKLRKAHKEDHGAVLSICRAHAQLQCTSRIICRIIEMIGDGSRVELSKPGLIPFDTELFLAAEPCLSEIKNMTGSGAHQEPASLARKVLLQGSLPSISQRKSRVDALVQNIVAASTDEIELAVKVDFEPMDHNESFADVLFPLLRDYEDERAQSGLLELYARQLFRAELLKECSVSPKKCLVKLKYQSRTNASVIGSCASVNSLTELTRLVRQASNSSNFGESNEYDIDTNLISLSSDMRVPPLTVRHGVFKVIKNLSNLNTSVIAELCSILPSYMDESEKCKAGPINVLHILVRDVEPVETEIDILSVQCQQLLVASRIHLDRGDVRRVSFVFCESFRDSTVGMSAEYPMPTIFTFRAPLEFREDDLFRNIEPVHAHHLELTRIAQNFGLKNLSARHMTSGHVHFYKAVPKESALLKDRRANKNARIFLRALSFVKEYTSANYERILIDALNALDLSPEASRIRSDNHLFINMVSDYDRVLDPTVIEQIVASILKRHSDRIMRLGIDEVETRVVCCLSEDSPAIALRMVASNPTGYVHVMNTYVEGADDTGTKRVFRLIGGTKASLAGSGDSSWENMAIDAPYPLTKPFDLQRKAALRASDTLYCYDLPALFEAAVERQWKNAASKADGFAACRPLMVMYTTELVVQKKSGVGGSATWTMQDYLNGNLELVQVQRGAGANDVGMVAWLMVLKTVEYPEGRQVVIIANDITFKAGSFGTREDVVFKMASEFAREKKVPRLFMAANSGARIGLADSVKKVFKVAFKDEEKPENGFEFLYLNEEDYTRLRGVVKATPVNLNGKTVHRVTDIVGSEPDLGVENLKGSGLIAGETSSAYNDIVTMTVVLGRTVGIGAYLVRLGQRTIQKTTASPIILTGYQALNKLMGCDVYSTNDQLGGPGIMYSNGVSHLVANDHLTAITHAIEWLSYVPSIRGGLLPVTDISGIDTIERPIEFTPRAGVSYDPRFLLRGCENDRGEWLSGFFDKGSFTETLAGWAKTVIVGRARLGGIPMGVVITENRTSENVKPADPADVKASEAVIQEAGCVWFPNSAYKTAQAINDFRTEDLPLIVFANWRGFSGGQRDMFDEVLKYGSLIVDAFVAYTQPVFVFIPPYAEIRGGAWVVLDSSINSSVMEMYASAKTARGGVLEANGAASVKYRTKDLIATMHRLDDRLIVLNASLTGATSLNEKAKIRKEIHEREQCLLPVYEQISVQFCELHDTPGRMKAVGVIEREVEWETARSFFYWRLRRKLAEFDLRKKVQEASEVGRASNRLTPLEAGSYVKEWFIEANGTSQELWDNDRAVVAWMTESYGFIGEKVRDLSQALVADEVYSVLTAGGQTEVIGTAGMIQGLQKAYLSMKKAEKEKFRNALKAALDHDD